MRYVLLMFFLVSSALPVLQSRPLTEQFHSLS